MECSTNNCAQKVTFEDVLKHDSYLRSMLRRIARDKHEENDMMQEGYMNVLKSLEGYRGDCALRGWLNVVFRNAAIAYLKGNQAPTVSLYIEGDDGELDEFETWLASDSERPDLIVEAQQRINKISKVFHRFPLAVQQVVKLRYEDDMAYQQIANVLKIPVGTVRSRLNYAHKKFGLSDL